MTNRNKKRTRIDCNNCGESFYPFEIGDGNDTGELDTHKCLRCGEQHTKRDERNVGVYLIGDGLGHVKIGITVDIDQRIKSLQTANPTELEVLHYTVCKNAKKIEKSLHTMYESTSGGSEWFHMGSGDVLEAEDIIKQRHDRPNV